MADETAVYTILDVRWINMSETGMLKMMEEDERTISPLAKSHPTTTSTLSFFKNSSISFV